MIQLKQEELIKSRGYRATIKAAYNLFTDNYKVILKHIWPYALAMAVVLGAFVLNQFRVYGQPPMMLLSMLSSLCVIILVFVTDALFTGRIMMFINGQSFPWNFQRSLKIWLWMLLLLAIVSVFVFTISYLILPGADDTSAGIPQTDPMIQMQQQQMDYFKSMGVVTITMTAFLLLLLPLVYIIMQYFVETNTHFHKIFFKGWKIGMKHWGYIFITLLVVTICMTVVTMILSLPLTILFTAYGISLQGVAMGDEAGLPGYFIPLAFVVSLFSYFIYFILTIFPLFAIYYIYGSIEAKEQEKRNLKLNTEY